MMMLGGAGQLPPGIPNPADIENTKKLDHTRAGGNKLAFANSWLLRIVSDAYCEFWSYQCVDYPVP